MLKSVNNYSISKYTVVYKLYASVEDRKNQTENFTKKNEVIKIQNTRTSNAGTARKSFLSKLNKKDKQMISIVNIYQ